MGQIRLKRCIANAFMQSVILKIIRPNLFYDEDGVVDELPLQHWVNDSEERLQVSFAVSERYDDGQPLTKRALGREPVTTAIDAQLRCSHLFR